MAGAQLVTLSFSAYGERRDVDWDGPITSSHLTSASNVTRHGFTDHLHLDSVKLVHMGGRVYDPVIGRFLSRDPYIDGVQSSQGANGYAYVWNNPLTRWDPTGYGWERDAIDFRKLCNYDICVENVVWGYRWEESAPSRSFIGWLSGFGSGGDGGAGGGQGGQAQVGGDGGSKPEGPEGEEPESPNREVSKSRCLTADDGYLGINGLSLGAYAGPGLEAKAGNDRGNTFGTLRVGLGFGGGASLDRAARIPGPSFDRSSAGWVISVTYDFNASWGPIGWSISGGAARNLTSGESAPTFDTTMSADVGTRFQSSLGVELTRYNARESAPNNRMCSAEGE